MSPEAILTASRFNLQVKLHWCKGCGLCVDACRQNVLKLDELGKISIDKPHKCLGCGQCEAICPDYVLRVIKNG